MPRPVSEGGPYPNARTIWLNDEQKRLMDSWGKEGVDYLRRCILTRGVGDKDAIELRIQQLRSEIDDREREIESLQSHLEDFLGPQDERVKVVVQRFFELGLFHRDEFTQKNWLTGPAQLGDDDDAFRKAWEMIQGKSNGEEGWGGD